jgi:hypothetical protein
MAGKVSIDPRSTAVPIMDVQMSAVLFATLEFYKMDPSMIDLGGPETEETASIALREGFPRKLQALAVGSVQHGPGFSHSSLLRMKSVLFDVVKID